MLNMIETLAIVLLAIGTLGSAWSALQASRWNGEQADLETQSIASRIESTKQSNIALQKASYDASLAGQYATAVAEGQTALQDFYRNNLFRKDFLPILDTWAAQVRSGAGAPNLFDNPGYLNGLFAESERLDQQAARQSHDADQAGKTADNYVLNTVMLATVLFFAGLASNYQRISLRLALVGMAAIMLAFAASRLATLPIQ